MEVCEENNTNIPNKNTTFLTNFHLNEQLFLSENITPNNNGEQAIYDLNKENVSSETEIISQISSENTQNTENRTNFDKSTDQTCISDVETSVEQKIQRTNGRACKKAKLDVADDAQPEPEENSHSNDAPQPETCETTEQKNQQSRSTIRAFKKGKCETTADLLDSTETAKNSVECDSTISNVEEQLGSLTTYNNVEGSELKSQQIRSSARVFKKMKLDLAPTVLVPEKRDKKEEVQIKQDHNKKNYRPLWSSDDKTIFFEALNEYGKDFESIQTYLSSKLRKKGVPDNLIKTKDQIRHLYYRTWHKVSKYVKFAMGVKKIAQELYALINYGELRKKIGSVSEKTCMKLNELIYYGSVILRIKGKNVRVKTPMCRALRRLNQLDDNFDEIKLPTRITVELRPKDMSSFIKVQTIAQNPRIRTCLTLQRRVSNLIACVSKRWKTIDAVTYDKSVVSSIPITNDCVPPLNEIEDNKCFLTPPLRLSPPSNCKIEIPSINLSEYFTRQTICLTAYENRVGIRTPDEPEHHKVVNKNATKKAFRQRTDSINDKIERPVKQMKEGDVGVSEASSTTENKENDECKTDLGKVKAENVPSAEKQLQIDKIRKGWTEEESQSLTIGEIYLMFGTDSKLILEYSWDETKSMKTESETICTEIEDEFKPKNDLSESLSKLLSVAKLHYRKNIIKCPCGHICHPQVNNAIRLKRAVESKIRNVLPKPSENNGKSDEMTEPNFAVPQVYVQSNIRQLSPVAFIERKTRKPRSKHVVVERKLPLLPNKVESGHQIVRMNIISQPETKTKATNYTDFTLFEQASTSSSTPEQITFDSGALVEDACMLEDSNDNAVLLNDSILSAMPSPSRLLKDNDSHSWINAEVADYSLSSLLGNLESPLKSIQPSDDSHLSQDADAQSYIHSLLTESSVDFSAKFADLAQVVNELKK